MVKNIPSSFYLKDRIASLNNLLVVNIVLLP